MIAELQILRSQPIAHAILMLSAVAVAGLGLGAIKYRGIALGSAGVLFAGIIFGHFGQRIDSQLLDFVKEFGLVLFVFTIGLQLGPGFVAAFRQQGLQLNLLAIAIVVLGAVIAVVCGSLLGINPAATIGVWCGASTSTPSLGAAQQTLAMLPGTSGESVAALPALAYAAVYPAGVLGIIGSILVMQLLFRVDPVLEAQQFRADQQRDIEPVERMHLLVENRALDGLPLGEIPGRRECGIVVSRTRDSVTGEIHNATESTVIHNGDVLLAVGSRRGLGRFLRIVGSAADDGHDLTKSNGHLASQRIVVTGKSVLGKSIRELGFDSTWGVTVTRLSRAEIEMTATPDLRLRFGDVVQVVGPPDQLSRAATALGNSVKALNETQFVPFFLGIAAGIVLGAIPIAFPGLPVGVRLGLAGGPLIMGIVLSRVGHLGGLVWHIPHNANMAFRGLGITLFLAAVGLKAGQRFFSTVFTPTGLLWVSCALLITILPIIIVGAFSYLVLKLNYTAISGLIAGSLTDTSALAFVNLTAKSDAPSLAYATVYPFTLVLRILLSQAMVIFLCR